MLIMCSYKFHCSNTILSHYISLISVFVQSLFSLCDYSAFVQEGTKNFSTHVQPFQFTRTNVIITYLEAKNFFFKPSWSEVTQLTPFKNSLNIVHFIRCFEFIIVLIGGFLLRSFYISLYKIWIYNLSSKIISLFQFIIIPGAVLRIEQLSFLTFLSKNCIQKTQILELPG